MTTSRQPLAALGDLVPLLCRSPFDAGIWGELQGCVTHGFGGVSATIGVWSGSSAILQDPIGYTWPDDAAGQFFTRYHEYEPLTRHWKRWTPLLRDAGQHRLFTSEELLPEAHRSDSDRLFYEEFADPHGIGHVGGILVGDGYGQIIGLYVYRSEPFDAQQLQGLRGCVEPLLCAVESRRFHRQRAALLHALERPGEGHIFIERDFRVQMMSAGTDVILDRAAFAIDARQRLTSANAERVALLRRLVEGGSGSRRAVIMDEVWPRFTVSATRSPTASHAVSDEPVSFHVRIVDLWLAKQPSIERLQEAFPALTLTEARVASLAATYLPRKQIADELGMSDRTVQSHLHSIYEKTKICDIPGAHKKNYRDLLRRLLSTLLDP